MKRFGLSPIMLNEKTGKLLAGHGRLETLAMFKSGDATGAYSCSGGRRRVASSNT